MDLSFNIFFPGKLVFGNGKFSLLAADVLALNPQRVFIPTIEPLEQTIAPFINELKKVELKFCPTLPLSPNPLSAILKNSWRKWRPSIRIL